MMRRFVLTSTLRCRGSGPGRTTNLRHELGNRLSNLVRAVFGQIVFRAQRDLTLVGPRTAKLPRRAGRSVSFLGVDEELRQMDALCEPVAVSFDTCIRVRRITVERDLPRPHERRQTRDT